MQDSYQHEPQGLCMPTPGRQEGPRGVDGPPVPVRSEGEDAGQVSDFLKAQITAYIRKFSINRFMIDFCAPLCPRMPSSANVRGLPALPHTDKMLADRALGHVATVNHPKISPARDTRLRRTLNCPPDILAAILRSASEINTNSRPLTRLLAGKYV